MWYSEGTVSVTNGGTNITGTGTSFLSNARVGDGITITGSTALHEIIGVTSNTQLSIRPAYAGTTGSGRTYGISPLLGYDKDLSDAFNALRLQFGEDLSNLQLWATADTAQQARDALGASASGSAVFTGTPEEGRQSLGVDDLSERVVTTSTAPNQPIAEALDSRSIELQSINELENLPVNVFTDNAVINVKGTKFKKFNSTFKPIQGVNIVTFGAIPGQDCTQAVREALDYWPSIYVPTGFWNLDGLIEHDGTISILGDGIGKSVFVCSESGGIIARGQAGGNKPHVLNGFSMLQSDPLSTQEAIWIDNSAQISSGFIQNRTSPRLIVNNVEMASLGSSSEMGWLRGLRCTSVLHATVNGHHFRGRYSGSINNILSEEGILFDGDGVPVEISISAVWSFHSNRAIRASAAEGLMIDHANLVAVNRGVVFDNPTVRPQLSVHNSHINAFISCIVGTKVSQSSISGNLLYANSQAPGSVNGIVLGDVSYTDVYNNIFVKLNSGSFNAIVSLSGGAGCTASGNIFQNADTAIWLQPDASGWAIGENEWGSSTVRVLDQGTSNAVKNRITRVRNTSVKTIPSGVTTDVPYDAVHAPTDAKFWSAGQPARLTANKSGTYQIDASIVFPTSASDVDIRLSLRKNGASAIGLPAQTSKLTTINAVLSLSATIELSTNDYITVGVFQNSGGNIDLPVAESYLSLRYVCN